VEQDPQMNPPPVNPDANKIDQAANLGDGDPEDDHLGPDMAEQELRDDQAAEDELIGVVSADEESAATDAEAAENEDAGGDGASELDAEQPDVIKHNPPINPAGDMQDPDPVAPAAPPPPRPGSPGGHVQRGRFADVADALEADMNARYGERLHHYNLRP